MIHNEMWPEVIHTYHYVLILLSSIVLIMTGMISIMSSSSVMSALTVTVILISIFSGLLHHHHHHNPDHNQPHHGKKRNRLLHPTSTFFYGHRLIQVQHVLLISSPGLIQVFRPIVLLSVIAFGSTFFLPPDIIISVAILIQLFKLLHAENEKQKKVSTSHVMKSIKESDQKSIANRRHPSSHLKILGTGRFSLKMMPVMIALVMRSFIVSSGQNCFGGIESFEKIAMTDFDESYTPAGLLLQQPDQALTRDCINLCKQQPSCLSFGLDYTRFRCAAYSLNTIGRKVDLIHTNSTNLF